VEALGGTCPLWSAFLAYMCWWLPALIVWELAWKGVALWRAGRNGQLAWFVCLFIFNTAGILPIVYIFAFSRRAE
jgi:hypothetical protein